MEIERQVEIMEAQIHSPEVNFTLMEKMSYLTNFFGPDPEFTQEAQNIVRSNICKDLKREVVDTTSIDTPTPCGTSPGYEKYYWCQELTPNQMME